MRKDRIIPLAMAMGSVDLKRLHLGIADLHARRILASVQRRLDPQARRGVGVADEADDHLEAFQRLATPGGGDMAEQAGRELVPLARARWQGADAHAEAALVGEALQFELPAPRAGAVAPAAVSGDEELSGLWRPRRAPLQPPGANRRDRQGRGVMVHSDTAPAQVGAHGVDPVGNGLAELGLAAVGDAPLGRPALGGPLTAGGLEVADPCLLLGIDGDDRLMTRLEVPHPGGAVLELGVAGRMLATFACLARPWHAVVGCLEPLAPHLRAHRMPLRPQLRREPPHALAGPAQRRLRSPPWGRLHQRFQSREQGRGVLDSPLAASARAAAPPLAAAWDGRLLPTPLPHTRLDRRPRQACRLGHQTDVASPQHHSHRRSPQPPSLLIQDRAQSVELFGDGQVIVQGFDYHTETLLVKFISRRLLSDLLTKGPVVLSFYRGGWCPYCNLELRAL